MIGKIQPDYAKVHIENLADQGLKVTKIMESVSGCEEYAYFFKTLFEHMKAVYLTPWEHQQALIERFSKMGGSQQTNKPAAQGEDKE